MKRFLVFKLALVLWTNIGLADGPIQGIQGARDLIVTASELSPRERGLIEELNSLGKSKTNCPDELEEDLEEELEELAEEELEELAEEGAKDEELRPPALHTSPINGVKQYVGQSELFFNFQAMATGRNGKTSLASVNVPRVNIQNVVNNLMAARGLTRAQVMALPDHDLLSAFQSSLASPGFSSPMQQDISEAALTVIRMSQEADAQAAFSIAEQSLANASVAKKVSFLATYLYHLNNNYEYDMLQGGPTYGEFRWDDDLHLAMQSRIINGTPLPAGVCRHMHQMAVRLAHKIGFDQAYGVSFRTSGSGHLTLVLSNPENPNETYQLNYGKITKKEGTFGSNALSQDGSIPDSAIKFLIHNKDDEIVASLPTELHSTLNQVTGGEENDLIQGHQNNSQINQIGINTRFGTFQVFQAAHTLGNGAIVEGGAYHHKINFNDLFYGEFGVAGFSSERETSKGTQEMRGVFGRATLGADAVIYDQNNLNVRAFGEIHANGAAFKTNYETPSSTAENKSELNGDFIAHAQTGIAVDYKLGPVWNRTSLITQILPERAHSTNGRQLHVVAPATSIQHDLYYLLDKESETWLNAGAEVALYNLGDAIYPAYRSHVGVSSDQHNYAFQIGSQGSLSRTNPVWLPLTEQMVHTKLQTEIKDGQYYFNLDARKSLEEPNNQSLWLNFGGSLSW